MICLLVGVVVINLMSRKSDDRDWLIRVLTLALFLRLAVATMFALLPETRFCHEDADGYEEVGLQIASYWRGEGPPVLSVEAMKQNFGYPYISGICYYVLGRFRSAPSYFNAILGTITIYMVYALARHFFHRLVARRAALLTALVPSMVLWNSLALKDTAVTLLIVLCLLSCVNLKERFSIGAALGTILPVVAVQPLRFYVVYFLVFAIAGSLLLERGLKSFSGVPKQIMVVGGIVILLGLVGFAGGTRQGLDFFTLESVSSFRHGMAVSANSGFSQDVDLRTPLGALSFLPLGMSVLLLGPFPWQFTSIRALLAAPEVIFWWSLFPSFLRGFRFAIRARFAECSPMLLFAVTLTCSYSLVHGNVGSGFRQRAQIFVFLFIFSALGLYQKRCRDKGIDERELLIGGKPAQPVAQVPVVSARASR